MKDKNIFIPLHLFNSFFIVVVVVVIEIICCIPAKVVNEKLSPKSFTCFFQHRSANHLVKCLPLCLSSH